MIEFILNNKKIKTDENPSMTLVDFIRENKSLKGTKIVCREGDCGACTVLVGQLSKENNEVTYQTITSCISPLANAHGKHIVTVEGLNLNQNLNQVQQSFKQHHASQCGFCTPGFVVAMVSYCLNKNLDSEKEMLDSLSGNICRCTGYVSIINAAKEVIEKCRDLSGEYTLQELIKNGFIPKYFSDIKQQLQDLSINKHIVSGEKVVAGGTDLYVQQASKLLQDNHLRFIILEEGQDICFEDDRCSISGLATVSDLFHNPELNEIMPDWKGHLRLLSSEAIRNMATVAGNFVNASPIGDMSAIMLALDAQLVIAHRDENRKLKLRDFFLDYKKYDLMKNETIAKIDFIIPSTNSYFNFEKVSKRTHLDIASVNSAMFLEVENNVIQNINIAVGGVAAIPKYLFETSKQLVGREIDHQTVKFGIELMNSEISPISDVRGTSDYKRFLAEQLFKAHFIKLFPQLIGFQEVKQA